MRPPTTSLSRRQLATLGVLAEQRNPVGGLVLAQRTATSQAGAHCTAASLVRRGLAHKQHDGLGVSYEISATGRAAFTKASS